MILAPLRILVASSALMLTTTSFGTVLTSFDGGTIAPGTSSYFVSPTMFEAGSYNVVSFDTLHPSWSDFYDHTSGGPAGSYMVVNGASSTSGGGIAWTTTVSVTAGTDYTVAAWFASVYGFATATLKFVIIGDSTVSSAGFGAPTVTATWLQTGYTFNTGASTSITIQIWDITGIGDGNDYAIDDITLDVVPTPASAAILVLGAAMSTRGRRRTGA